MFGREKMIEGLKSYCANFINGRVQEALSVAEEGIDKKFTEVRELYLAKLKNLNDTEQRLMKLAGDIERKVDLAVKSIQQAEAGLREGALDDRAIISKYAKDAEARLKSMQESQEAAAAHREVVSEHMTKQETLAEEANELRNTNNLSLETLVETFKVLAGDVRDIADQLSSVPPTPTTAEKKKAKK